MQFGGLFAGEYAVDVGGSVGVLLGEAEVAFAFRFGCDFVCVWAVELLDVEFQPFPELLGCVLVAV